MHLSSRRVLPVLLFMAVGLVGMLAVTAGHAASRTLAASSFEVKTGEWYYDPKEISVAASSMVSITLQHVGSASIPHDIKFELGNGRVAASKRINGGGTDVLGFAAPAEPGEYVFYCSVGNHRSRGMEGKLVVTGSGTVVVPSPGSTETAEPTSGIPTTVTPSPRPSELPSSPTPGAKPTRWWTYLPQLLRNDLLNQR